MKMTAAYASANFIMHRVAVALINGLYPTFPNKCGSGCTWE